MPREIAVVIDHEGRAIYWHCPSDNTAASIPDSQDLWHAIWDRRDEVAGVAHTHPWEGTPFPSDTDTTTWSAIERGLGKRLIWPIVSMDSVQYFRRFKKDGKDFYQAVAYEHRHATHWLENIVEMRQLSQNAKEANHGG